MIPTEMPVNGQDIANYLGQLWNKNEQIQIVLKFDSLIDFAILEKAVRLSLDVEPILGCEFVINQMKPVWRRHRELDQRKWCTLLETEDIEETLQNILCKPFISLNYQLEVYILRSKCKDTLCIKLNHFCSDGGGAKRYIYLLKQLYLQVLEKSDVWPQIDYYDNRTNEIFRNLNVENPALCIDPKIVTLQPTWAFPHENKKIDQFNYSILHLSKDETDQLSLASANNKVTWNDIILTAYYRALFSIIQPDFNQLMEICVTMDLRKYLINPEQKAICNLSGVLNHRIIRKQESGEVTLSRVADAMREIKENNPGLHSAASIEMLSKMDFEIVADGIQNAWEESVRAGKSTVNLSNFGIISAETLCFGETAVLDAFIVTPVFRAPSFMLGASTYKNKITFTVGFCEPEVKKRDVESFLLCFKQELLAL